MSDQNITNLIHIVGAIVIGGCYWLAFTTLRPFPEASLPLVGMATFLFGALGFKPLDPVLATILQRLNPAIVDKLSHRPPPPPVIVQTFAGPIEAPPSGVPLSAADIVKDRILAAAKEPPK